MTIYYRADKSSVTAELLQTAGRRAAGGALAVFPKGGCPICKGIFYIIFTLTFINFYVRIICQMLLFFTMYFYNVRKK